MNKNENNTNQSGNIHSVFFDSDVTVATIASHST